MNRPATYTELAAVRRAHDTERNTMNDKTTTTRDYRVFDTKAEKPYTVRAHRHPWMRADVKSVVFKGRDEVTKRGVEVMVHWTEAFEHIAQRGNGYHTIDRVVLENGDVIHTNSYSANWPEGMKPSYNDAPVMVRGAHRIVEMMQRATLIEVVGASKWAHSKRDAAATEAFYAESDPANAKVACGG